MKYYPVMYLESTIITMVVDELQHTVVEPIWPAYWPVYL